jgi:hypothetical protein
MNAKNLSGDVTRDGCNVGGPACPKCSDYFFGMLYLIATPRCLTNTR